MQNFDAILNLIFIVLAVLLERILFNYFSYLNHKLLLKCILAMAIYTSIAYLYVLGFGTRIVFVGGFTGEWMKQNILGFYVTQLFMFILALIYYELKFMLTKKKPLGKALINIICLSIVFFVGLICAFLIDIYVFGN